MSGYLPDERLIFVDLEAAGGESWRPIIQVAAIALTSDLRELECYEAKLCFDEKYADPRSLLSKHYSRLLWRKEARPAGVVLKEIAALLRRHATIDQTAASGEIFQVAQLVAHNAPFDQGFLEAWFARFGCFLPASPRALCTMQRAIWLFHENKYLTPPSDFKLGTLCEYFGIRYVRDEAHEALNDVRVTVELYRAMNSARRKTD